MATYRLTSHERLTVVDSAPGVLAFEAEWDGAGTEPLAHLHPSQEEHFEVLEGRLAVSRDGRREVFAAGESFDVLRGVVHAMAPEGGPVRARWEVRPPQSTERMFAGFDAAQPASGAEPSKLALLRVLARHRAEFRLAGPPDFAQRVLFGIVRAVWRR